jgi:hypothetical protein
MAASRVGNCEATQRIRWLRNPLSASFPAGRNEPAGIGSRVRNFIEPISGM